MHEGNGFQFQPFFSQLCPFFVLLPNFKVSHFFFAPIFANFDPLTWQKKDRMHVFQFFLEGFKG